MILHGGRLGLRVCSKYSGGIYNLLMVALIAIHLRIIQELVEKGGWEPEAQGLPTQRKACLLPGFLPSDPSLGSCTSQVIKASLFT